MFKVCTLEGWYEIPDAISVGVSPLAAFATKTFFVLAGSVCHFISVIGYVR